MSALRSLIAAAGLACISACSSSDRVFFSSGVGSSLFSESLSEDTRLQQIYIDHICRQAGLVAASDDPALLCLPVTASDWTVFVQAGLNDIDQRCDGYLAWLDSKRRNTAPILQQIADMQNATAAILAATSVSAAPLSIVGAAFGLARNTFTNLNSRLIMELDQSTVQTVVLTRQTQFRQVLPKLIDNRPAALYALRSYLRLCMPFTIETQVNTTIKLFERSGISALEESQENPLVDARNVETAIIRNATTPLVRAQPVRTISPTRLSSYERTLDPLYIEKIQVALCLAPTRDLGPRGSVTRKAIASYLAAKNEPVSEVIENRVMALIDEAIERVPRSCGASGFKDASEVGRALRRN